MLQPTFFFLSLLPEDGNKMLITGGCYLLPSQVPSLAPFVGTLARVAGRVSSGKDLDQEKSAKTLQTSVIIRIPNGPPHRWKTAMSPARCSCCGKRRERNQRPQPASKSSHCNDAIQSVPTATCGHSAAQTLPGPLRNSICTLICL